ncbi:hypothetical protein J3458_009396 [Metarhizium acridum]|uniref:uncharacterized protein n=1 Tax=Metarhizium acridum TaxID=92637 RepID=UPI001C6CE877|nr:hypothetical protein J3458_009396 [Metarhizium acridum]
MTEMHTCPSCILAEPFFLCRSIQARLRQTLASARIPSYLSPLTGIQEPLKCNPGTRFTHANRWLLQSWPTLDGRGPAGHSGSGAPGFILEDFADNETRFPAWKSANETLAHCALFVRAVIPGIGVNLLTSISTHNSA